MTNKYLRNAPDLTDYKVAHRNALVMLSRVSAQRARDMGDVDPAAMQALDYESRRLQKECTAIVKLMVGEMGATVTVAL